MKLSKPKQMVIWMTIHATIFLVLSRLAFYFHAYVELILFDLMLGMVMGMELMFVIMTVIYEGNDA